MVATRLYLLVFLLFVLTVLGFWLLGQAELDSPIPADAQLRAGAVRHLVAADPEIAEDLPTAGTASHRIPTTTRAVASQIVVRGQVTRHDDQRPIAECKVLLFLVEIPETYERVPAEEIQQWVAWTDTDGHFELAVDAEPGTEWRGALHAHYPGMRRGVFPMTRIEPNRDIDVGRMPLVAPTEAELRSSASAWRGMVQVMELLQRGPR